MSKIRKKYSASDKAKIAPEGAERGCDTQPANVEISGPQHSNKQL